MAAAGSIVSLSISSDTTSVGFLEDLRGFVDVCSFKRMDLSCCRILRELHRECHECGTRTVMQRNLFEIERRVRGFPILFFTTNGHACVKNSCVLILFLVMIANS